MKTIFLLLNFIIIFLIQGCSSTDFKTVAVDSYFSEENLKGTYYLELPSNNFQLQNLVFANLIKEKLSTKGYISINSKENAKTIISFSYDVKGPYTVEEPYLVPINTWWGAGELDESSERGWNEEIKSPRYYVNKLVIKATTAEKKQVWEVQGSLKMEKYNIGKAFPYLLLGISPYIGVNSNEIRYIQISEENTQKLLQL